MLLLTGLALWSVLRRFWRVATSKRQRPTALLITAVLALSTAYGAWFWMAPGADMAPDSLVGTFAALAGLDCLLLATVPYILPRKRPPPLPGTRAHRVWVVWHSALGAIGLTLAIAHATGRFNASRSGTYTLYALIALVACGAWGRVLDAQAMKLARRLPLGDPLIRKLVASQLVRAWRTLHRALAIVFVVLLLWHLTVVAGLLFFT